ncbi:AAA family ATPase [Desulforhopalus sp. 52FAK]
MIRKIIDLHNVGKFEKFSAKGDVTLKQVNLFYGENGRGKTTLCSILRSLKDNNSLLIKERKTLGTSGDCKCKIQTANGICNFTGDSWDQECPQILVFDSDFVNNNIYTGDTVDHQHKKNLFQVIVGEEGVKYYKEIDKITGDIKEINQELKLKIKDVEKYKPENVPLKEYLAIQENENIDTEIVEAKGRLKTIQEQIANTSVINTKPNLATLVLPVVPIEIEQTLLDSIEQIDERADEHVKRHLESGMAQPNEKWLSFGANLQKEDNCPFCGQDVSNIDLIKAYKTYFNQQYKDLLASVNSLESTVNSRLGESAYIGIKAKLLENQTNLEYWRNHLKGLELPVVIFESIDEIFKKLLSECLTLIKAKQQAPISTVELSSNYIEAKQKVDDLTISIQSYNQEIAAINQKIGEFKQSLPKKEQEVQASSSLAALALVQTRHTQKVKDAVNEYVRIEGEKTKLEDAKKAEREKLDQYCDQKMGLYEDSINSHLACFNTGFSITKVKHNYSGGSPNSQYHLKINNVTVGLNKFKTSLSSGDRNSLALAFFLASLDHDSALNQKLVAFDDPFTSLDRFRRESTAQLCKKISDKAKQVIVLSHDPYFLKLIYDKYPSATVKTLQIPKFSTGSTIVEWNIEEALMSSYMKNYSTLIAFLDEGTGDLLAVARAIRPFLEGLLRTHFPGHFQDGQWLGDFIQKIRNADDTSGLCHAKSDLEEIESINDYSKKYHHEQNPNADSEFITHDELEGFTKRTIALVGGI